MRTVFLVTRHQDLARFGPALERSGLSAPTLTPDRLASVADTQHPDAVVLDMRDLPASAFNILVSEFNERSVIVICVLEADAIERLAVDLPIDDFLVLPAEPGELARRVERTLWRRHGIDSENFVSVGTLQLDLSNYRVTVSGEPVVMTFKEYELLRFLAMNAGRVFTREQLLNRVWGYDYFGGARTVDVHIRRIRAKIEIHGHEFIETVRNVGYRLVAESRSSRPALTGESD
jgi:two-component system, OmpR family, alkaline phosphatase synthesis response regulator PhoP